MRRSLPPAAPTALVLLTALNLFNFIDRYVLPGVQPLVQKEFHDLVVSTYGRGIYILDDITPLEQMAQKADDVPVRLFAPRDTFRLFPNGGAPPPVDPIGARRSGH